MTSLKHFRSELRDTVTGSSALTDVLLRIVVSEGNSVALTGGDILRESQCLAQLSIALRRAALFCCCCRIRLNFSCCISASF